MDEREKRAMHDITTAARRLAEALRRNGHMGKARKLEEVVGFSVAACKGIRKKEDGK